MLYDGDVLDKNDATCFTCELNGTMVIVDDSLYMYKSP